MFDISLFEMVVIGVVALIVIGPERLPGVARTAGHLFGRMQRYVNEVKSDIQREIELDELKKLRESVEDSAREIEQSMSRELNQADQEVRELKELIEPAAQRRSEAAQSEAARSERIPSEHTLATTAALPDAPKPEASAATDTTLDSGPEPDTAPKPDIAAKTDSASTPDAAPAAADVARSGMAAGAPRSA
jgi:sec-independent protein translocase protein TatB